MTDNQTRLESFVHFLLEHGILDNESDQSESISKFFQQYDKFPNEQKSGDSNLGDGVEDSNSEEEENGFETRAIFTLADFFKVLEPNECYDIA